MHFKGDKWHKFEFDWENKNLSYFRVVKNNTVSP